ncbi:MAG: arsenate reductase ArsC [Pseudomonadota bacterium]
MVSVEPFLSPTGPTSVLFTCTHNAIRSPMAEAMLKHQFGHRIYVDSVGLRAGELDLFAVEAMREIGIDLSNHSSKDFDELVDDSFDMVVSLSPEAHHHAIELTRTTACEVEYWPTLDPSLITGNRDARLDAYRQIRDQLRDRIRQRFDLTDNPRV